MQGKNYPFRSLCCFLVLLVAIAKSQTAPNISSLSPSVGPVSPVGGSVTIKGSGFGSTQEDSAVSFGGLTDTPISWGDTQIIIPVPSTLPTGFADVFVTVNGANSNVSSFLVIPVITSISPEQGVVGTSVTIAGTSFEDQQNDSTVTFNGTAATPSAWSNTAITVPAPVGASVGYVVVTVNGFSTNGVTFFVLPNITGITPAVAGAGSQVTILGSGFGQIQGFGGVTFNGTAAAVQSWSDTAISAVVPDGATAGNVLVTTELLLTSNGFNFTPISPLVIVAFPDRGADIAGWYNAPVTVNFTCSGGVSPVICPPPQTLNTEGANQIISGTATDTMGSTANTSIRINLDETAPSVVIGSPATGATVSRPTLRVTGTFTDNLSDVASVTCSGVQAALSSGLYVCNVPLTSGMNNIQVQATDNAGNVSANTQIAATFNPIPPNAIFIAPAIANMLVGNNRSVRLVGDVGQIVSGATWGISDPTIVSITTDDPPQLTALAQGTATLTASFGQLQASMTVNVFSGQSLPFGTPFWSAAPITGGSLIGLVPARPINPGDPDIYMIDGASTLDALTADGQLLWAINLASGPSSGGNGASAPLADASIASSPKQAPIVLLASSNTVDRLLSNPRIPYPLQQQILGQQQRIAERLAKTGTTAQVEGIQAQGIVSAQSLDASVSSKSLLIQSVSDNNGDSINVVFKCPSTGSCQPFTPAIIGVDNASQSQLWENDLDDGPYLRVSSIAIGPDNTIYISGAFEIGTPDSTGNVPTHSQITAIDGLTGQTKFKVPVDPSHITFTVTDPNGNIIPSQSEDMDVAAAIGPLAIMPDGSVQMMISSSLTNEADTQQTPPCILNQQRQCALSISHHLKLQLLSLQPGGGSSLQQVRSYDFDSAQNCVPNCVDPGSANDYIPGDTIPDGSGGILGSWTENKEQNGITNQLHLSQNIRDFNGFGGFLDYNFPGLIPLNLAADPSENLILGDNNTAFGVGAQIVGFIGTSGVELCNSSNLFPSGASLIAPTSDPGLLATQLSQPIFGNSIAVELFSSSCAATTSPLPASLSNVVVFDPATLLAITNDPFAEAFGSPVTTVVQKRNTFMSDGNRFFQRAPLPNPHIQSMTPNQAGTGRTSITVTLKGTFNSNPSVKVSGTGITPDKPVVNKDGSLSVPFAIDRTAALGDYSVTVSDDGGDSNAVTFSIVCATPQDLTSTTANFNNGTIVFNYSFKSSTGDPQDLAACKVGESVFYPGSNPMFVWPLPMVQSTTNPTVITSPATNSALVDKNGPPNSFQTPYFAEGFTAKQRLWYSCGCKNNGNLTNFLPDLDIVRRVFQDTDGLFKYQITKQDKSNTITLPNQ